MVRQNLEGVSVAPTEQGGASSNARVSAGCSATVDRPLRDPAREVLLARCDRQAVQVREPSQARDRHEMGLRRSRADPAVAITLLTRLQPRGVRLWTERLPTLHRPAMHPGPHRQRVDGQPFSIPVAADLLTGTPLWTSLLAASDPPSTRTGSSATGWAKSGLFRPSFLNAALTVRF